MTTSAAATSTTTEPIQNDQRDLEMEGHLRAIGLWCYLGSALSLLITVMVASGGMRRVNDGALDPVLEASFGLTAVGLGYLGYHLGRFSNGARRAVKVGGRVLLLLTIMYGLGHVFGSIGNGRGDPQPDKIFFAVVAILVMLAVNVAILWAVDSDRAARICTPEYQDSVRAKPVPYGFVSLLFWAGSAAFAALIGTVL
jgi:hypothetical protein